MTSQFSQPVVCPVLVGREKALEDLGRLANEAVERGRVVLISGEAGIGKTRLVREFLDTLRDAGSDTWQARFYEQDTSSPYSGMRRLLADVADRTPDGRALIAPFASALGGITPELFDMPGFDAATALPAVPESEERRVLDGLRRLSKALCSTHRVVLAFEDVHWADSASLAAILEISRDATPGCLIVLTSRSDEGSAALTATLAELERERLVSEVRLNRLGLADVDKMLAAILSSGRASRADVLHLINRLSDGNPFFVEEVTRSLLERAGGIEQLDSARLTDIEVPRGVNDAVRRRTEGLSASAGEVLSLAAVAGVRFDFPLLSELAGLDDADLLRVMKELIAAQLVVEEGGDTFAFRHALTREAIRSQLLQRERRALSKKIAFALEGRDGATTSGNVEDLAWHFYEAGEWAPASKYCRAAGEHALALYAPVEALSHLTRAVDAGERAAEGAMADVYRLRGSANEATGNFDAARADYERAVALAEANGEGKARWLALIDLGLLWASRDYTRSEPYYRAALTLARELGDPEALGHSLNRLGNLYSNQGDFDSARAMSEEALATFRGTGDELGIAQTLDLLGMTCLQGMQFSPAVGYYREAIEVLERLGDKRTLASALSSIQVCASTYQTSMLPPGISLAEGSAYGERGLALSRQLGWRAAEAYASWQLAFCLGSQGEYARALQNAREAEWIAREIGHTQWEVGALCALGAILIDILAVEEAEECLRRAEVLCRDMRSNPWAGQVGALLIDAKLAHQMNRPELVIDPSPDLEAGGFGARVLLASRGDLALANGDLELASSILERLEPAATDTYGGVALRVARLRARMLAARGDLEGAATALRHAEEAARDQGNASYRWRLNADLASVLLQAGDRRGARVAALDAHDVVDSLARAIPESDMAANFVARAAMHLPAVLRGRTGRERRDVLTVREVETARLIAGGLTNREIAGQLVLSVRTVESHVANAMAKLGFTSRAQLAAWAAEYGLLDNEAGSGTGISVPHARKTP